MHARFCKATRGTVPLGHCAACRTPPQHLPSFAHTPRCPAAPAARRAAPLHPPAWHAAPAHTPRCPACQPAAPAALLPGMPPRCRPLLIGRGRGAEQYGCAPCAPWNALCAHTTTACPRLMPPGSEPTRPSARPYCHRLEQASPYKGRVLVVPGLLPWALRLGRAARGAGAGAGAGWQQGGQQGEIEHHEGRHPDEPCLLATASGGGHRGLAAAQQLSAGSRKSLVSALYLRGRSLEVIPKDFGKGQVGRTPCRPGSFVAGWTGFRAGEVPRLARSPGPEMQKQSDVYCPAEHCTAPPNKQLPTPPRSSRSPVGCPSATRVRTVIHHNHP